LFGVADDNILAVFIDFIIVARSMNNSIMSFTRLGLFAVLGLTSCSNMNPGASAALIGGLSGAAAGIIARQAGLSNSQSVLIGSAVGIAAGTITYNYHKRRATERELATARLRATQYQNQVSSGSKPRSKTRYIAVPATASKTSSQAASTVVLFDTQTNSAVGNNVYEMDQRPKKGDVVKFDTFNAEYVGL
jgi:hypothetical protein